ncbi:MAG: thioredoxin [Candidatus Magasanikbacteria bacterium]|nr:thioredoxin [Candidatus Magasanikbacteria bacterium]
MEHIFTEANFNEEVLKSKTPVFIDFWAAWCGPCQMMSPIVEEMAKSYEGKNIKIGKCNVDENPEISSKYNIMSIPSFMLFKNGEPVDQVVGGVPKEKLQSMIDKHL